MVMAVLSSINETLSFFLSLEGNQNIKSFLELIIESSKCDTWNTTSILWSILHDLYFI